jgi:hypothetical protein
MNQIINNIMSVLECCSKYDKESLQQFLLLKLQSKGSHWIENYPVRVEHDKVDKQQLFTFSSLQALNNVPKIDLVFASKHIDHLTFTAKRSNDFWKRISSVDHIEAMLSILSIDKSECGDDYIEDDLNASSNGQWRVETLLRDTMRANKENRDLGTKPFIVILAKEKVSQEKDHLYELLKHYFSTNVEVVTSTTEKINYYIAYHEHMGEMGMRYFYRFQA